MSAQKRFHIAVFLFALVVIAITVWFLFIGMLRSTVPFVPQQLPTTLGVR